MLFSCPSVTDQKCRIQCDHSISEHFMTLVDYEEPVYTHSVFSISHKIVLNNQSPKSLFLRRKRWNWQPLCIKKGSLFATIQISYENYDGFTCFIRDSRDVMIIKPEEIKNSIKEMVKRIKILSSKKHFQYTIL